MTLLLATVSSWKDNHYEHCRHEDQRDEQNRVHLANLASRL